MKIDAGYRIDLLVENAVIVELKAVERIAPIHEAQLLSYLKMAEKPVGLLINLHVMHLRDGIRRLAHRLRSAERSEGKSVSVRVEHGGRHIIKKNKIQNKKDN